MFDLLGDLLGEANISNHDYVTYTGEYDFFVKPTIRGMLPYENTTISIQAFNNRSDKTPRRIKCKWFREINSRNYHISDNKDESYHINSFDIGAYIKVAVRLKGKFHKKGNVAILKFGPIRPSNDLSLDLEKKLTKGEGVYGFNLLKYGDRFINDHSQFRNFVRLDQDSMTFQFSFRYEEEKKFCLKLNSGRQLTLVSEMHDSRAVTVYYEEEDEFGFDGDILENFEDIKKDYEEAKGKWEKEKERANKAHSDIASQKLSQLSLGIRSRREQNMAFGRAGQNTSRLETIKDQDGNTNLEEFEEEGNPNKLNFEIRLKFRSREEQATFIAHYRVIRIIRSLTMAPLIESLQPIFEGRINEQHYKEKLVRLFGKEYVEISDMIKDTSQAINRLLEVNKNLTLENDNLFSCTEILETDLALSMIEFKKILR
jgi:hypothetical protein